MRAVLKTGPTEGFSYATDVPEPVVGPGDVLVQVGAASLCGTDRELYDWTPSAQAFGADLPVVMGHEGAGTVLEVGDAVTSVRPGDRVAMESHVVCGRCYPCRTGDAHVCERTRILGMHLGGVFAERTSVPEQLCVRLPEGMSFETGALLEPASVAMHAVQRSGRSVAGRAVLVNGAGPVGLVVAALSRTMGAAHVVVVEPNPHRRARAEALGALALAPDEDVVGTCRELTGSRHGVDVAVEVSGVRGVLPTLFEAVRSQGDVVTVGHPGAPVEVDVAAHINKKGVTLRGIFGRRLWDSWEDMLLLLGSGRLDLDWLVTHRLPLAAVDDAVGLLSGDAAKVLLLPDLADAAVPSTAGATT